MGRLKSGYVLGLIALTALPAVGQQLTPRDLNVGTVAVVGDIEHCDTYPVPGGETLTVRQAVINAGLVSEFVNVTVIRCTQDRPQWTQSVSAMSADTGEPVEIGDVLVVQALSPLTAPVRKNAVLRWDSDAVVVSLEQDGVVIGDVLQAANHLPPADGQLKVLCRFSGQKSIAKPELYHLVAHGDVISISRSDRTILKGFGNLAPTVSEWKGGGVNVARDPVVPNPVPASDRSASRTASMVQQLQLLSTQEPSLVVPLQMSASREANAEESDDDAEVSKVLLPALAISQSEDVEDAGGAEAKIDSASESMTVAPVPPAESQVEATANLTGTAFNPWNLVFIGGLLLAGTLILAGTMKSEPNNNLEFSHTASMRTKFAGTHVDTTGVIPMIWRPRISKQRGDMRAEESAENLKIMELATQADETVLDTKALVTRQEWFSSDWHGGGVSSMPSSQDETVPAVQSVKAPVVDEQSFSQLEDLLQNRLPIDLCETHIPLRISIFGRPAGPRRLRVDAPHAVMPAPHLNLAPEKRRVRSVVAPNPAATPTPSVAASLGSLDRALYFLQERTES